MHSFNNPQCINNVTLYKPTKVITFLNLYCTIIEQKCNFKELIIILLKFKMNTKDICKNFKKNGFVVLRNFLSKPQLKKIFFQLNQLIDVPLESINTSSKKNLTLDEKYLLLKEKNPKLKSRFYETITYLDSINSISNSCLN